jgi:hypothetical protein
VKLVHLVGFITKKFVTMHGHRNVKFVTNFVISNEEPNSKKLPNTNFNVKSVSGLRVVDRIC